MLSNRAFYYAKGKAWHFWLLGLALAGFLTLAYLRAIENERVSFASIFPFLVLVPMAAFAFRGNYDRRPVLTISADGVWFSPWNISAPLSWASVVGVKELRSFSGLPYISLRVEGERTLPSGRLDKHSFCVTELDVLHQDALRLVNEYWQASRGENLSK